MDNWASFVSNSECWRLLSWTNHSIKNQNKLIRWTLTHSCFIKKASIIWNWRQKLLRELSISTCLFWFLHWDWYMKMASIFEIGDKTCTIAYFLPQVISIASQTDYSWRGPLWRVGWQCPAPLSRLWCSQTTYLAEKRGSRAFGWLSKEQRKP